MSDAPSEPDRAYDHRSSDDGGQSYHYSNQYALPFVASWHRETDALSLPRDGSYYYQNSDGSKYYNSGDGYSRHTSSGGKTTESYGKK